WRLATVYYGKNKFAEAVALLRRCPDQQNIDVREQLGLSLYKSATPAPPEAVKLLEDVVTARPEAFSAPLQLGLHYLKTDPKKAATLLGLYFKNKPSNTQPAFDEQVRAK